MTRYLRQLTLALLFVPASAQNISKPPAPNEDHFVGTWKANQEKSVPKLSERGATYTRTITRSGDDLVLSSTVGPDKIQSYRLRCDGKRHHTSVGILSCTYKNPDVIEGETKLPGKDTEYWSRSVSEDGKTMTILGYKDSGRTQLISTWVLDRVN